MDTKRCLSSESHIGKQDQMEKPHCQGMHHSIPRFPNGHHMTRLLTFLFSIGLLLTIASLILKRFILYRYVLLSSSISFVNRVKNCLNHDSHDCSLDAIHIWIEYYMTVFNVLVHVNLNILLSCYAANHLDS